MDKKIAGITSKSGPGHALSAAQQRSLSRPAKRQMPSQQKRVLKWILIFFALMIAFTIFSRAADSLTVPMVTETGSAFASTLNFKFSAQGMVEAKGSVNIPTEEGYRIKDILVSEGQSVKKGDVLVLFDQQALQEQLQKVKNDLAKAQLQEHINNFDDGSTDPTLTEEEKRKALDRQMEDSNYSLLDKERAIEKAQELLHDSQEKLLDTHQDLDNARQKLSDAQADLEKAKGKSQTELIKDAQDKAKTASKDLENAQIKYADDLKAAGRALEDARDAYNQAYKQATTPVNNNPPASSETDAEGQNNDQNTMNVAPPLEPLIDSDALNAANKAWARAQEDYSTALFKAEKDWVEAQQKHADAQGAVEEARTQPLDEQSAVQSAEQAIETAEQGIETAQTAIKTAEQDVRDKERGIQEAIEARDKAILDSDRSIDDKMDDLQAAQKADSETLRKEALQEQKDAMQSQLGSFDMQEKIDAVRKVEAMIANGGEILAPQDGTIDKIEISTGQTTTNGVAIKMSDASKGYRFKAIAPTTDVKNIKQGDKATITPAGESRPLEGILIESLRPLTGDQSGQTEIIATLPDTMTDAGLNGELKVEKQSGRYNTCVKASAIRGSENNYSVLVLRERPTILGKQSYVEEIKVRIVARDSNNVALEDGSLFNQENVVIRATKPLANNDRVRVQIAPGA